MSIFAKHIHATPYSFPGIFWDANVNNFQNSLTFDGSNRVALVDNDAGANRVLSQATPAESPVLTFDVNNGKPAIYFDGIDDGMNFSSELMPASISDFTLYFLLKFPVAITPSISVQAFLSKQIVDAPRAALDFGPTIPAFGETMTLFEGAGGRRDYIKDTITSGAHVIKIKLSAGITTIAIDGVNKTVFPENGGINQFSVIDRLGANVIGFGAFWHGYFNRGLAYAPALSINSDNILTEIFKESWL